ncbi:putative bifunctional diguanylate cyclase/phosphodiesterase [Microvirga guangxiensis]|uniref:Diguanylate cyclase (GGDEF) domain-containing protein n=1 Tax=Microvirga guangxiensis TaxID=549386 RepID=A0A1G5BN21_9HYPH|nr:EAL domain-containing protein [Microvirga guangxiensis]SCX91635.1 diguanylate cyclase (GGDEF) domain-containing protein [Microvirga guangxiensis]
MLANVILILSILTAVAALVGAAFLLLREHNDDLAKAEGDLASLALTLQERTDATLQSIENVLRDVVGRIPQACLKANEFDGYAASQATKAVLVGACHTLALIQRIDLVNARGRIVGTSYPRPLADPIYLRDTSYYQALANDPSLLVYLSEPVLIRATGKRVFSLSQKIKDTDGNFLGLIVSTIDLGHFEKLFDSHLKPRSLAITFYRRDGIILAHSPKADGILGRRFWKPSTPLQRMVVKNSPTLIRDVSWIDRKERLVALHPLAHYPSGIAVSRTLAELMAGRRLEARLIRFIAHLMDIAIDAASLLGMKHVRTGILRAASESYLSRHDILTRLPNRLLFSEELKRTHLASQREGRDFALHLLDLNRFKDINDSYGHAAGDEIIRIVARRLRDRLRKSDFIARIGSDEFAIVQRPTRGRQQVMDLVTTIQDAMKVPCTVGNTEIEVGLSIGVAIASTDGRTSIELMKAADVALYAAKSDPDRSYRLYDASIKDPRAERRALEGALKSAHDNREFELYYQPILDLATNRMWGCEALVRWKHPAKGMVSPLQFIPAAEESGLIGQIGDWILEDACSTAMSWDLPLKVAVNLSPVQFQRRDVFSSVKQALDKSGMPAQRLVLEITESVKLTEEATATLKRLKALGVSISLDDFGTGYASMSYLRSFPFDKIKIDQSFVRGMMDASDSRAIIKATIGLANDLKISTTAEGVETEEQLNALRLAGASQAQGYLIAKPMSREAIATFISDLRGTWQDKPSRARATGTSWS